MHVVLVTYPKRDGARFDEAYYTATHMPLVRDGWTKYGLTDAQALYPSAAGDSGFTAVAVLSFRDDKALQAALASPEAPGIMGDVPNFTDIEPAMHFLQHG
ncbi:EthD family reductase [Sphingomonas sp. S1-29]|uniref:EthD family reductase n=1 Tax=Sphingomonas sp. S1-29 TaxID=2991074 RepID=UPI00223FFE79|nr:EthD family reductase [Sphingomonas sp. S1-29]UZK68684.1 EthD family reductase [Sphingomonas sp. S1-29]